VGWAGAVGTDEVASSAGVGTGNARVASGAGGGQVGDGGDIEGHAVGGGGAQEAGGPTAPAALDGAVLDAAGLCGTT
jgi:hypothetical protein